jgi:hypothetical protein
LGTIPAAGSDALSVIFTPYDTTDYTTATASVTLTVSSGSTANVLPTPVAGSISPAFSAAGGPAFTLTVNGSDFTTSSTIYWGSSPLTTQYMSANQLIAQVPATAIATEGITEITIQTPGSSASTSSPILIEVDSASGSATAPAFTSVTVTAKAGSTAAYQVTLPTGVSNISISCLNLPLQASCSYSSTSNTVAISTSSATPLGIYQVTVVFTETITTTQTAGLLLPLFLLPLVRLRKRLAFKGAWIATCLGLVFVTIMAMSTGCGGGSSTSKTTATTSAQATRSAIVSLTVQ